MNIIYILLTFLAIGLTSVGVGLTVKYRSRTRLTYLHETCLPLFMPGILGLRDIQVLYQEKSVDAPLYLFAGHFFNSGNTDIPKSSIHNPLLMRLPKAYEWSAPMILKSSAKVRVERTTKDKSRLAFEGDLLKKNEFFKFAALVKAPLGGRTGKNSGTPENPAKVVFFRTELPIWAVLTGKNHCCLQGENGNLQNFSPP